MAGYCGASRHLQQTHNGHLAVSVEFQGIIIPELGSQPDNRECGSILQGVGQMLVALAHFPAGRCFPRTRVFGQTLAKSNRKGNSDDNGHDDILAAGTVRLGGSSQAIREKTCRN